MGETVCVCVCVWREREGEREGRSSTDILTGSDTVEGRKQIPTLMRCEHRRGGAMLYYG